MQIVQKMLIYELKRYTFSIKIDGEIYSGTLLETMHCDDMIVSRTIDRDVEPEDVDMQKVLDLLD